MNLENGTIINQYKIISAIGKGGMGEVFLAQDTKLDINLYHCPKININTETAASDFIAGQYETDVVEKYVKEALAAAPKPPNGVYVDFISKMPILQPEQIKVPTLIIYPERDFLATESETLEFFGKLGTNTEAMSSCPTADTRFCWRNIIKNFKV